MIFPAFAALQNYVANFGAVANRNFFALLPTLKLFRPEKRVNQVH